jgi:chorismate mutase
MTQDSTMITRIRGIRGATRVDNDDSDAVRTATREMLTELLRRNNITADSVVSAFFTVTHDLVSEFPARAAREIGWKDVAMLCSLEIPVRGSLDHVIRVLLHAEIPSGAQARHVYMNGAEGLRPDL